LPEATQAITLNADQSVTAIGAAQITTQYGPGPDNLFGTELLFIKTKNSNGTDTVAYYHNDQLGTPVQATDKMGNIVWSASYNVFGQATITTPEATADKPTITSNLRLPGQYYDEETGLHYNYFRDYDSTIGRYLTSDPIGLRAGLNTYTYALSNPLSYTDPLGLAATAVAIPLPTGGFAFAASGDHYAGTITGTFNTGTTNFNQIQTGTYSVTPRPSLPDTFINELFNRNKNAGRPTISNTNDWNTIINPDGSITHGAQIHPGKNGTNGGTSLGCMVTDQSTYDKLNKLFQDNYNDGGVTLIVLPAP